MQLILPKDTFIIELINGPKWFDSWTLPYMNKSWHVIGIWKLSVGWTDLAHLTELTLIVPSKLVNKAFIPLKMKVPKGK